MAPPPERTMPATVVALGRTESRLGPIVPLAPAARRVWQLAQPAELKTAAPAAAGGAGAGAGAAPGVVAGEETGGVVTPVVGAGAGAPYVPAFERLAPMRSGPAKSRITTKSAASQVS